MHHIMAILVNVLLGVLDFVKGVVGLAKADVKVIAQEAVQEDVQEAVMEAVQAVKEVVQVDVQEMQVMEFQIINIQHKHLHNF